MKKFLIGLTSALLVAGIGVGGYFGYKHRDNIKSWFSSHNFISSSNSNVSSEQLRKELDIAKSELSFEQSKNKDLVNQLTEKQQENTKLNEKINEFTTKISENEKTIKELQQNAEQNASEITRLQSENEQLKTDKNGLQQTVNENAKTIENLQSQIANKDSRISELEQQVSQLQEQLNATITSNLAQKIIDRSITEIKASDLAGVTKIGDYAFYACKNLVKVELPDSVTEIGEYAFGYCDKIEEIVLPNSITSLSPKCFYFGNWSYNFTVKYNGNLTEYMRINFPKQDMYKSGVSIKLYIDNICINDTGVTIPNEITDIPSYCFSKVSGLENIVFHNNVNSIGDYAFYGCGMSGVNIVLPNSLTKIGNSAFDGAFTNYNSSLYIPSSVTSYGYERLDLSSWVFSNSYADTLTIDSPACYQRYCDKCFKTVKVLKSVVDDESNANEFLNNESNFTKSTDGDYYVYTKVS